jgi:SAM-dependent methyltransferase
MRSLVWIAAVLLVSFAPPGFSQAERAARTPDVIFVPTPQEVVDEMLKVAGVKKGDVLYDLGSGDGRIPVTAAKRFGIRAVGIDIDPERIKEARANAKKAGVDNLVKFRNEDLFKTSFRDATVVTLYLLPELNVRLRPRLLKELKPGTRIVSHQFDMGDWKPEKEIDVDGRTVYFWTVPAAKK